MIYTVGHSNHTIEHFLALLQRHGITLLADVRSTPYSRFNPQFRRDSLAVSLNEAGIEYLSSLRLSLAAVLRQLVQVQANVCGFRCCVRQRDRLVESDARFIVAIQLHQQSATQAVKMKVVR